MIRSCTARSPRWASGLLVALGVVTGCGAVLVGLSCTAGNQAPIPTFGPIVSGNVPPTLTITDPKEDVSVERGGQFSLTWTDADRDSNARIAFDLVDSSVPSRVVPLVDGLVENDLDDALQPTPETFAATTSAVPPGRYHLRGTIRDDVNAPVQVFATLRGSETARVIVTVTEEGFQPVSQPPTVVVIAPAFNLSITQDDELVITVQPTPEPPPDPTDPDAPPGTPYDADSDATLYILLDLDDDPTNDDPENPDPDQIIVLSRQTVDEGATAAITITEEVDLSEIPLRADGKPYFVRATIDDGHNQPFHAYANGTIHVGQSVSGTVDLANVGGTLLGATFQGFNPGSNLGWRTISARDFDADGVEDMVLVARFGNPRNFGNIGEAYLIYGLSQLRFGGRINVNSTSTDVSGVIFEGTPPRFADTGFEFFFGEARSEGITDAAVVSDLTQDGRPDLLFGLAHVDGIFQGRDDDPGDDPPEAGETLDVELIIRQGHTELTEGDEDPVVGTYSGFEDTHIDSANPDSNFGAEDGLEWDDGGAGDRKWTLIRIRDLLPELPDTAANITDLSAELAVRVANTGDNGTVHECFTQFSESSVTFNNFATAGGEPQEGEPGDPDADYDEEELGDLTGTQVGEATVDITDLVQKLIDGELTDVNNEILVIVVPEEGGENNTRVRSSEFNQVPDDRPTLTITYSRALSGSAFGCYPDPFVNNWATEDEEDAYFEALGFVTLVDSENRDNAGVVNPNRLESTVVSLELAGQEGLTLLFDGLVSQYAQADEVGRISGARFTAGWYDWVDHLSLNQPPLEDLFGMHVDSVPDINNDQLDEILISAPTNERDVLDLEQGGYFPFSTHLASRPFTGSIIVLPGSDYGGTEAGPDGSWRDKNENEDGNASIPFQDNFRWDPQASCDQQNPDPRLGTFIPYESFEIFAESVDDWLGQARYAGDVNLDGVSDILCGAPLNDAVGENAGAAYVVYGRTPIGDFDLGLADDTRQRPPMIRIRGATDGDRIGYQQERLDDVNGDRIADIVVSSPAADFGGVLAGACAADFDGDGDVDSDDLAPASFSACLGQEVFIDDACKAFDYDNDRRITEDDQAVLECLIENGDDCCPVDNGFVGVIFGGITLDGDRSIDQVATSDLPGAVFYGASPGDRAGASVSSAGDFNQDGFGDLLLAAPGEVRRDAAGEERVGAVYLVFGGPHLTNRRFDLSLAGTDELPGIVFLSPYVAGRPDEAPPDHVGAIGDINDDGFSDIAIGNTTADFVDENLPQEPGGPGTDPSTGRRPDAGEVYIIYGNNFGGNR